MINRVNDRTVSHTLTANGYAFSYIEAGEGAPLVFVHGSLLDYRYWQREVAHFSSHYRTIAMSRRHHWPNAPVGEFHYGAVEQTDDVVAFIDQLNAGPVHLVGHSYGGYIAARIACLQPDTLLSLTLIEPGGPIEGEVNGRSYVDDLMLGAKMVREGDTCKGVAHFLDTVCTEPKWEDGSEEYRAMTLSNALTTTKQVMEVRPTLAASDLERVSCPVLLMQGERSISPFPETLDRLQEIIPRAQRFIVPGASHMINVDNYAVFIKELEKFLQGAC